MKNISGFKLSKELTFKFLFSIFLLGFTGCQQEDSMYSVSNEEDQIIESNEFFQYVKAHLTLVNKLSYIQDKAKPLGFTENKTVYSASKEVVELYNNVAKSRAELITKYPSYNVLSDEDKGVLYEKAILKYNEIASLITEYKPTILRLKSQATEYIANSSFSARITPHAFSSADEAYDECRSIGACGKESGGYVFADGSAIWFFDSEATIDTMYMIILTDKSYYDVTEMYHYHPYDSNLSGKDSIAWNKSGAEYATVIYGAYAARYPKN